MRPCLLSAIQYPHSKKISGGRRCTSRTINLFLEVSLVTDLDMPLLSTFPLLLFLLPTWTCGQASSSLPASINGDGNNNVDLSQPINGDEARLLDGLLPHDPVPLCKTAPPSLNFTMLEYPTIFTIDPYQFVFSDYSGPWTTTLAVQRFSLGISIRFFQEVRVLLPVTRDCQFSPPRSVCQNA